MHVAKHIVLVVIRGAARASAISGSGRWTRVGPALVGALMLGACASATSDGASGNDDPLEPLNRVVFAVNDVLDQVVLRPVSYVYKVAVPDPVRDVVRNFLRWLKSPVILANDVMQGDWNHAGVTTARFLVNGTLFGIVDAADGLGLAYREEDFGQTLGTYGVPDGAFLMLPLLGPSNVRDMTGLVVDYFIDPFNYLGERDFIRPFGMARGGMQAVDFRAENFDRIDDLRSDSIDFYAKVRSIYRQQRKAAMNNGFIPIDESIPDLSEQFDRQLPTPEASVPQSVTGG
ncbi:VacJ family lipoprotein [Alphaproteobacteria bacterium]|nr:VacJ family lipoprotein [Alphaproteobacteria bacterium]